MSDSDPRGGTVGGRKSSASFRGVDRTDAKRLFTEQHGAYDRFIRLVRYPQGIRAFFLRSSLLGSGLRILDAGCGAGVITLALHDALVRRRLSVGTMHGFDLTPAMLKRFREALDKRESPEVDTRLADVLKLEGLPDTWKDYDLIVTASMLEYVPRDELSNALAGLRQRLADNGHLVLFITRRNWLTHWMIGRWWQSNVYEDTELVDAFRRAGFSRSSFSAFPLSACYLALWGYVIEARR